MKLLSLLLLLVCHAPQAAMTDVPRFWPLLDCTILSRHSITRSSLAPSSTSLHEVRREEAATAVLSVCLVRGRDSYGTCAAGVMRPGVGRCCRAPSACQRCWLSVQKLFCGFQGVHRLRARGPGECMDRNSTNLHPSRAFLPLTGSGIHSTG